MTALFFVLSLASISLTRGYFWLKVPDDMMLRMLQHRQGGASQGEPIPLDSLEPKRAPPQPIGPRTWDGDDDFFDQPMRSDIFDEMERGFRMLRRPRPIFDDRGGDPFGLDRIASGGPAKISETSSSVESHETYVNDGQHKPRHTATVVGSSQALHGDDPKHLSGDAAAVKCKNGKCVTVHAMLEPKSRERALGQK
ncbi:hypothetical protein Pmar_PMAR003148 [Perkinsus marinus ATCC 50983]|uniref:Uncharacterized protein n=1 Tax=Perkinsus marinus (strain ATCC 50983 / TXsc) TaxID=423536 RepID=C5L313_PERM5|nr:hypothetical protein Pmar_PMAR003148 [Perkinsus marinus ATCC 50983]EER08900.1 hypothetical protein Pmar_PMAR003148 [Perkinsus marinus ATCC 50983]|eukprot:XP_002777084.1 hypothetical protein Pmar_PMAR003148 [Perkinsus marinus ATCC 50983]